MTYERPRQPHRWRIAAQTAVLSLVLACGAGAIPISDFVSPAFAKGGAGGGGGNGGAGADGRGGRSGDAGVAAPATPGARGVDRSSAANKAGGKAGPSNLKDADFAAALGKLNAAHASPTARANASANSVVGQLAAYRQAVLDGISQTSAKAMLANIANKPVTDSVVSQVNALLGVDFASSSK